MIKKISKHTSENSLHYFLFVLWTIFIMTIISAVFLYLSVKENKRNNLFLLEKEAANINVLITDTFNYSNHINCYIGRKISERGGNEQYILNLFQEIDRMYLFFEYDKVKNRPDKILSWSSFDWVNTKNFQTINSVMGIRKDPPNMSARQYTVTAPQDPWKLKISFPALGEPSKAWIIPAGTGVVDKNNKFLGIVTIGFGVAEIQSRIQQKLGNSNVSFTVVDNDANIVLQSSDNNLAPIDDFYKKKNIQQRFTEKSGKLKNPIVVNNVKYSYYYKMDHYPYVILTGFNHNILSKEFNNLVLPRILEFVAITAFFLFVLYLFKTRTLTLLKRERDLKDRLRFITRSISHDLHNYIFSISGLAHLVLDKNNLSDKDSQILKSIIQQSEEADYFIGDLLDNDQIYNGKLSLGRMIDSDIVAIMEMVILASQIHSRQHDVTIIPNLETNLPALKCDPRRMKQIFMNLISNAIKYSYKNGQILINISRNSKEDDDHIQVSIEDCGIGMSEDEINMALSGRGLEIDKSALNKNVMFDSHGLGMPIIKHLVDLHQGKMQIFSQKNSGTKIILRFKISALDEKVNHDFYIPKSDKTPSDNLHKKILVVDDNPVNLMIIKGVLNQASYQVIKANNGKVALEMLDENPKVDLIIMDGQMFEMDGYEATRHIRKGEVFKKFTNFNIPIIALMGDDDEETLKKVKECGMNDHVKKSASVVSLIEIVSRYINKS